MVTAKLAYRDLNRDCVLKFLQHVVIVDNRLYFSKGEQTQFRKAIITPAPRIKRISQGIVDDQVGDEIAETKSHELNAKKLIESFADKGIICCPYIPEDSEKTEKLVERTFKIARNADIVVLDWKLGGPSTKVISIIKEILKHDLENGGRLRLITIYTGEVDVVTQYRELIGEIFPEIEPHDPEEYDSENIPADYYTIDKGKLKITFINKVLVDKPQAGVSVVKEEDLPDFLVAKFTEMTMGLMPNLTLASIAALRHATHHILAKYDKSLDPAILTHRALLTIPEEAENFAVSLMSDEIRSILEITNVGSKQLGMDKITQWLNYYHEKGLKFDFDDPAGDELELAQIVKLLRIGIPNGQFHSKYTKKNKGTYSKNSVEGKVSNLFSATPDEVKNSNLRLSRFSNIKRESNENYYLKGDWFPTLKLGSILRKESDSDYLLCIQPVCDSNRIPEGEERNFPFLKLVKSTDIKFDLVVKTDDGDECFKILHEPRHHVPHQFAPNENGVVVASKTNGNYYFKRNRRAQIKFKWIGDVKEMQAQREVLTSSAALGRVGLDEYEWLRRLKP